MNKILTKLNSVPGLVGSMICDSQGRVLADLFPPNIDTGILKTVASIITDNAPAFQECTGGVKMFNFKYEKGRVVVKPDNDRFFVMLCSNSVMANLQVLDMLIDVASKQLDKTGKVVQEKTVEAPNPAVPTGPKLSPSELMEKGPLSVSLSAMQVALAKFLGPMAKIIFEECVEKWLETNAPSKETLPELTRIINQEIDDHDKSIQFMKMIAPYM